MIDKDKFEEATGMCGCADDDAIELLVSELRSVKRGEYSTEPTSQAFRLLMEKLGWISHGISIRASMILPGDEGEKILEALK